MTRDWITNEIFRRVEPQGRTMGEYFEEEINADIHIRVPEHKLADCFDFRLWDKPREIINTLTPEYLGRNNTINCW